MMMDDTTYEKERKMKSFVTYFDGVYDIEPRGDFNTFQMGVTKLDYDVETNVLTVWLRRPGLLIGNGGKTYKAIKEYLECEVHIKEVIIDKINA